MREELDNLVLYLSAAGGGFGGFAFIVIVRWLYTGLLFPLG